MPKQKNKIQRKAQKNKKCKINWPQYNRELKERGAALAHKSLKNGMVKIEFVNPKENRRKPCQKKDIITKITLKRPKIKK